MTSSKSVVPCAEVPTLGSPASTAPLPLVSWKSSASQSLTGVAHCDAERGAGVVARGHRERVVVVAADAARWRRSRSRSAARSASPGFGEPDSLATTGRVEGFTCQRNVPEAPTSYVVSRWSSTVSGVPFCGNVSVLKSFVSRSVVPAGAVPSRIEWRASSIVLSAAM